MLDLSRLSLEQRQAVLAPDGPLLILAGPGSGKTTVLAARIAYAVIARRTAPESILALAFGRKAARELQTRLVGILGQQGQAVDVTTFHAFGLRLIRGWQQALGYGPGLLAVLDAHEAQLLLREVTERLGMGLVRHTAEWASQVARYRLRASPPSDDPLLALLVREYESALRQRQAVDFTAMLTLPLRLFETCPAVLRACQAAYHLVACDEGQDVCPIQYTLLKCLVEPHHNLTLVGDPAQSIFGWRGADAGPLLRFGDEFPNASVVHLRQNFRSTQRIVALANRLGAPLASASPLSTPNPVGEWPRLHVAPNERREALFVADEIERLQAQGQLKHGGEVAVLYRTNRQAADIALALRERRLPYHIQGQVDLLTQPEVKVALALLRLAHNPLDEAARRSVLPAVAGGLGHGGRLRAATVTGLITELHAARRLPPHLLLDLALDRSGYQQWLAEQRDAETRLSVLADLRRLVMDLDGDLEDILAALALDDEDGERDDAEAVTLTTIHKAKGCEWRVVFVVGVEEGLLPHAQSLSSGSQVDGCLDEERRLAYVAVTRPRERLYLTWRRARLHGPGRQACQPSRFLTGLPLQGL